MKKIGLWMYTNEGGYLIREKIVDKLHKEGYEVIYDFDMRECYIMNGCVYTKNHINLSDIEVLFYMNADERNEYQHNILRFLELSGVRLINSFNSYNNAMDKASTNMILSKNGINTPPCILVNKNPSIDIIEKIFNEWGSAVLKKRIGGGGEGILKFESYQNFRDFIGYIDNKCITDFYLEKYIDFDWSDCRVEFFEDKIITVYGRKNNKSFKTNVHQGGDMIPINEKDEYIKIATQAKNILGLDTTIVDMIKCKTDGKIYVLEVNELMGIFYESYYKYLTLNNIEHAEIISEVKNDNKKINYIIEKIKKVVEG
jgi:ribosomal protein S6--L-glutamate ligase